METPPGIVFALVLALIIGSFMVVMPLVRLATDPVVISPDLPSHKQNAETLLYFLTFVVFLPFWLWQGPKIVDLISRGSSGAGLGALAGVLTGLLAASIALVRVSANLPWGAGIRAILLAGVIWSLIAGAALFRASRGTEWRALTSLAGQESRIWISAGALTAVAAVSPVRYGHVDTLALVLGLLVAALITFSYGRVNLPDIPRGWKLVVNAVVVLLVLLAVPDMVILAVERGGIDNAFAVNIIQFHQNLWLGAASQVTGGSALLVDTVSQYGIAPIYLIAGFFKLTEINHLTLGIFDGVLSAGVFATGYLVLRAAGVRTLLATFALAIGVVALVWDLTYPMGGLLQHGALRFGLPMLVVAFQVAGARWPRFGRASNFASLAVVGLSSIWALEAFIYVSVTWFALLLLRLSWEPAGGRMRWMLRRVAEVVAAWVFTQVLFALLTLLASGSLPDWGLYLSYLRDFLTGDIGDLTYDFTPWSRGFIVAGVYVASAIGLTLIATSASGYALAKKPAMVALATLTGYGIGLFSYYDNRSLDHVLPYVSLPALLVATIWLSLWLDAGPRISLLYRRTGLAAACVGAAMLVSVAMPAAATRSKDSLLAYVIPGGTSLSSGFDRIRNPPEFTPGASEGASLVEQYMPGRSKVAVLTKPDLDTEIHIRSDTISSLGIFDANEQSWVPGPHEGTVDEGVAELGPAMS
ncbi:MAG: hypothetical protein IPK93_03915 [Solirubrobacterales bacterium]|nr:hypothetical protein [Solirubrobacterales bacterium]